jgi:hypothetical protein
MLDPRGLRVEAEVSVRRLSKCTWLAGSWVGLETLAAGVDFDEAMARRDGVV